MGTFFLEVLSPSFFFQSQAPRKNPAPAKILTVAMGIEENVKLQEKLLS